MFALTELGNRLKEAREAKGITLDELQNLTKIQKRYLLGIEEGNYKIMPGKFYIRAFIKQYAEAVDLNPEEIFDLYKEDVPSIVSTELPELSRVKTRKSIPEGNSKVLDLLPKVLIIVFLLGAAGLAYYFLQKYAGDQSNEQLETDSEPVQYQVDNAGEKQKKEPDSEDKSNDVVTDNPTPESPNSPDSNDPIEETPDTPSQEISVVSSSGYKTTYELKNTDRFELKLVSTGETWVNMKNGKGFSLFQGMLKKGGQESQTVDYSKESEAVLIIGRSIDTEIYVNDQKVEYAIAPGDEVRQDIVIRFVPTVE
ncbi:RodZ domain-containing protein [Pseudoneobacillus sp. C159]